MNIVLVNHYAGGKSFGMEFRPYYLAREWQKAGHNVIIVAASFAHLRSRQPKVDKTISAENVDGVNYIWIKTNSYEGNGINRILSMLGFTKALYSKLGKFLDSFSPDLFIASSTYPFDSIPLAKLARKYKAKLCFEVHDLWPLSPIEFGGYSKYHPFIIAIQWAEDFAYRNSDFVVSLLPMAKPYMVSRGMKLEKFIHIPNGIALDEWNESSSIPAEHLEVISGIKNKNKFLVGYAGSHGIANGLDALIFAAEELTEEIEVVFVGSGPEKKNLQDLVNSRHISNVNFLPSVSKECIPALLKFFDALYVAFQKQSLLRFGISPNKMFDYMMAEKPIIQAIEAGNNLVKDYACGVAVEPQNPESITLGIRKLEKMSLSERQEMGRNGKNAVMEFHDFKILSQKFIEAAGSINYGNG